MVRLLLDAGANPWVKVQGMDLVPVLVRSKESFLEAADSPPEFRAAAQAMRHATDEVLAMLAQARRKTPRPAGF
jgi:hypothetical protein